MRLDIIHLSDIHLENKNDHLFEKTSSLISALDCDAHNVENAVVIVSGDIANSGNSTEYKLAEDFFETIKNGLSEQYKSIIFICVPGNHDCDFSMQAEVVRKALLKSVSDTRRECLEDEVVQELIKVQKNYRKFSAKFTSSIQTLHCDDLLTVYLYEQDGFKIIFKCFNTAWVSQMHEVPGMLTFPYERYEDMSFGEPEAFTITLFHHSLGWLSPDNARGFKKYLEKTSSIVITGHDHIGSAGLKDDFEGDSTELIEGRLLQDRKAVNKSAFNLINFDFSKKEHCIKKGEWADDHYEVNIVRDWFSYDGLKGIDRVAFGIKENFKSKLNSLEINVSNSHKEKLFLDDVFIYPNINEIQRLGKTASTPKNRSSEILFDYQNNSEKKFLIIGEEKSGKSTILKKLFLYYYDSGYVPLYIEGDEIKSTSKSDIDKLINKKVKQQYCDDSYNNLVKNDKTKKVLLIDDFHISKLNSEGKSIFIDHINEMFPIVFVTGNSMVLVEEMSSNKKLYEKFVDYDHYGIKLFGKLLRYKIVEKWNRIGREHFLDERELVSENDRVIRIIEGIVGNNLVPSYPLYLLTIIQSIEAGTSFSPKNSTFGYYYEFLITRAFGLSGKKPDELDLYYNYATELAWHFFQKKTRDFSRKSIDDFHDYFTSEFQRVNKNEMIDTLLKSGIICETEGSLRFSQKYAYYFFVAKCIAAKLSEEEGKQETKELIEKMSERVHIEEFFNIIMFLSHFSKDPFVLRTIVNKSKKIFSDVSSIKFTDDISGVNKMISEIPQVVMHEPNYQENRERQLKISDSHNPSDVDSFYSQDYDLDADIEGLNYVTRLNLAFKMVEVLGQIVRNHFGSLRKPVKHKIVEEAYDLGLRSLQVFFMQLQEDCDRSVETIKRYLSEKKAVKEEDVEDISRRVLFNLCELISYSFIKKISSSLGSEKLFETFDQVLNENQVPSVKLIDLCIKLEFENSLPFDLIASLFRELKQNFLAQSVLKTMVLNYVYMFPTTAMERQKICTILSISPAEQRQLELGAAQSCF